MSIPPRVAALIGKFTEHLPGETYGTALEATLRVLCALLVKNIQRADLPIARDKLFKRLRDLTDSMAGDLEKLK
ncbi:hypothetical protein [Microcystis phage Mwe-JY08]